MENDKPKSETVRGEEQQQLFSEEGEREILLWWYYGLAHPWKKKRGWGWGITYDEHSLESMQRKPCRRSRLTGSTVEMHASAAMAAPKLLTETMSLPGLSRGYGQWSREGGGWIKMWCESDKHLLDPTLEIMQWKWQWQIFHCHCVVEIRDM